MMYREKEKRGKKLELVPRHVWRLRLSAQKKGKWLCKHVPSVFYLFGYQPMLINNCQQRVG